MQSRLILFLLVLAFCLLDLLIGVIPIRGLHTRAISLDDAYAIEFKAAIKGIQQDSAILTRSELAKQTFQEMSMKAQRQGMVPVIVRLRVAVRPEGQLQLGAQLDAQRVAINQTQDVLLRDLYGHDPNSIRRFAYIPYLAIKVNTKGVDALRFSSNVIDIQEDKMIPLALAESVPLIGAPVAWSNGFTGAGKTIAILDTGVDKTHPFLSGKVVSEACYSTNLTSSGASSICPGGVAESISVDSGLNCTVTNECVHGTHVAGIAAGRGSSFSGVAKDADLIAIQVFSRIDSVPNCGGISPCVRSFTSDLMKGLERVYALSNSYSIAAVNMSLGGGRFTSYCDNNPLKSIIDQLRSVGIATVIASGNSGYADAISSPACISSAISVGATGDGSRLVADAIAPYSNSASFLNLLAPGDAIQSSIPGGGFAIFSGTSMAAPHVAGAWAIMRQQLPSASVTDILNELTTTGVKLTDTRNGLTFPRINLLNVSPPASCIMDVPSDRWRGEYYNNRFLSGSPAMVRNDGAGFLNFDFGVGGPSAACGLGVDNFSMRWTRTVNFAPGTYRFTVTGDDGVRLYIDGQLWIDQWHDQGATTYTADVSLSAGDHVVVFEYYENGGGAVALLSWMGVFGPSAVGTSVNFTGSSPKR